jgi:UDP-N-acetylmuramyl tripeptide synthase
VLECARGGLLRRGLATTRATAAVITNISMDHFGEYGVHTLRDLTEVKSIVARALDGAGRLVLNADDTELVALAPPLSVPVVWFSADASHPLVQAGVRAWGDGAVLNDGHLLVAHDGIWTDMGRIQEMPLTLRGAARHNIANVLAAALVASCAGAPPVAVSRAVQHFGSDSSDNAGRLQRYELGGVHVVTDYAHNPSGIRALAETAASFPANRRLLLLGQAGDRDDAQLVALAQAAWGSARYHRVILKEMPELLRGREPGAVTQVLRRALLDAGAPAERLSEAPSELAAVREALQWAQPGDLLVLPAHTQRTAVGALLQALVRQGWQPGEPLPPE